MSTDTSKIRSKVAKLNRSLDELEAQLEPLFAQSLPETLLALDAIQQAKLQVIIPYVVYDLVFVYLKSRGIDPKTHRVVAELERVREYFDKIKNAEEFDQKRKLGIDKVAASRFIKHAIAQAKNVQPVDGPPETTPAASSSSNTGPIPVKVTSKMIARAEYEKELEELGSEEEDDLEVFDEEVADEDEKAIDVDRPLGNERPMSQDKGKGRAPEKDIPSLKRKRPHFSGIDSGSMPQTIKLSGETKLTTPVGLTSANDFSRGVYVTSDVRKVTNAEKKAKRKVKGP